jgi:hypothetical protein
MNSAARTPIVRRNRQLSYPANHRGKEIVEKMMREITPCTTSAADSSVRRILIVAGQPKRTVNCR